MHRRCKEKKKTVLTDDRVSFKDSKMRIIYSSERLNHSVYTLSVSDCNF